ncbi:MAG TPA: TetR/AcrR family transcriptional regulator [Acidimicrobiia bacterium]|nr:TetR/AcrR family transcriptional regulator [Acidimicrobiia bacterium]
MIGNRERLVEAASELLHEHPYHAVGVQTLCDRAGVRKGSFYHFFGSKEELTIAAVERAWTAYRQGLDALPLDDYPVEKRLRLIVDNCLASPLVYSLDHERLVGCPFGRLAASITEEEPELRDRLAEIFTEWLGLIAAACDGDSQVAWSTLAEIQGTLLLRATLEPAKRPGS